MGLDHIDELLYGRLPSRLILVVSDLEELDKSVVELIGPSFLCGRIVLLTGASPSLSNMSVLCLGSLEFCGLWVTAGTDPKRVSRLVRGFFLLQFSNIKELDFQPVQSLLEDSIHPSSSLYDVRYP